MSSFIERMRQAIRQGEVSSSSEQTPSRRKFERNLENLQREFDEAKRRREEKFNRLSNIVDPVLNNVGEATWGEGNYEIYKNFTVDDIDSQQFGLQWKVFERHEKGVPEYYGSYELELRSEKDFWGRRETLNIKFNPFNTLRVPVNKEALEDGFLKAARTGGPRKWPSKPDYPDSPTGFREGG